MWDRFFHGYQVPNRTQLIDLLIEVSCDIFPNGPDEKNIWEQAGGEISKLNLTGSGQQQWQHAIRDSQYGAGTTIKNLTCTMLREYPNNPQLQYLNKAL